MQSGIFVLLNLYFRCKDNKIFIEDEGETTMCAKHEFKLTYHESELHNDLMVAEMNCEHCDLQTVFYQKKSQRNAASGFALIKVKIAAKVLPALDFGPQTAVVA